MHARARPSAGLRFGAPQAQGWISPPPGQGGRVAREISPAPSQSCTLRRRDEAAVERLTTRAAPGAAPLDHLFPEQP
eukprot:1500742-Pyramimonas_sp.AAC.1